MDYRVITSKHGSVPYGTSMDMVCQDDLNDLNSLLDKCRQSVDPIDSAPITIAYLPTEICSWPIRTDLLLSVDHMI